MKFCLIYRKKIITMFLIHGVFVPSSKQTRNGLFHQVVSFELCTIQPVHPNRFLFHETVNLRSCKLFTSMAIHPIPRVNKRFKRIALTNNMIRECWILASSLETVVFGLVDLSIKGNELIMIYELVAG